MFSLHSTIALLAAVHQAASLVLPDTTSLAAPDTLEKRSKYHFNELVVFGDDFSDNGNGSYAHGITDGKAFVYGYGTWTNGPIAASYLSDLLGIAHRNLAWGGCCGGGSFGATIDNSYTPAQALYNGAPVPSVQEQIHNNYTLHNPNVKKSLQFIWTGHNDLVKHSDAWWETDPRNLDFASNMASRTLADAEFLIGDQGAPLVMVANIYPKHLAPVTTRFLCQSGACVPTFGKIISSANDAIKTALAGSQYASQIFYYDVYTFMVNLMADKDAFGLTQPLTEFCDGDPAVSKWEVCIAGSWQWEGAEAFYWMNYIQPTTHVHRLIAADMKTQLDAFLSG